MAGRTMKLTRDKNDKAQFRKNTERLDNFQKGMEDLQPTPNKHIKAGKAGYYYKQIQIFLKEQGFVKNIDMHLVNLLAIYIDIYYQAYEEISKHGIQYAIYDVKQTNDGQIIDKHHFEGYKPNPAVSTLNTATNQIKTLSDKLGMSPTSRASMLAKIDNNKNKNEPSIQDLIFGGDDDAQN